MQKIIIEGGVASVYEESKIYECKTEDMLERFLSKLPVKTKFMPRNIMYYERREDQKAIYVVEICPRMTRINWVGRDDEAALGTQVFRVSMPFLYFFFSVSENENNVRAVFPACSKEPIRDMRTKTFIAPISNVHESGNGYFCLGDIKTDQKWPLFQKIDFTTDKIFSTNWNADLSFSLPAKLGSYKKWHEESLKDPMIWMKAEYADHKRKTFGSMVEFVLNSRTDG